MITTPNGIMIPIIFKGGLPYIEQHYHTDAQIRDIKQEEIMTSPGEWNPSLLDNSSNTSEQQLKQLSPTSIDTIDNFYNMEENIIVQKNDINKNSIVCDDSSTSSGSRWQSYRARTRKEKHKKHYGPKGKEIKWMYGYVSPTKAIEHKLKFSTHPPDRPSAIQTNPMNRYDLRIKGVPNDIVSNLRALVFQSRPSGMAQSGGVIYFDSNSDDDNSEEEEESLTADDNEEKINNDSCCPIDAHKVVTGTLFKEDRVAYVQKCLHWEYYYAPCNIYSNTDMAMEIWLHLTDTWSLCENAPLLNENPNIRRDEEVDEWMLEYTRHRCTKEC